MALISEYLAADLSADASADTLCIINIGNSKIFRRSLVLSIQGFLGGGWFCAFAFNANVSLLSSRAKPYEEK